MPRRRFVLFAVVTVVATLLASVAAVLAVDVYLHRRVERSAGVNIWGYRGPAVGRKAPGEVRIVVLGGSAAFGYGLAYDQAFPFHLEQILRERTGRPFSVVNLAFNNEAAYSLRFTLEDYAYLDYDAAIFYEGYNDISIYPRTQVFRRDSPVFRLTGYLPMFPLVFREKAYALLHGGDVAGGYEALRGGPSQTVFRPGLADQATATALAAAARTAESLERQLGRLSPPTATAGAVTPAPDCGETWSHYCGAMHDAIVAARGAGLPVLIGGQPLLSDSHVEQQRALQGMLLARFGADPGVRYADVGRVIDLHDRALAYDGMHLTNEGNRRLAQAFFDPLVALLEGRRTP